MMVIITGEEWERKLDDVKIRKEDMNKLVMDFLVIEGYVEAVEKFRLESGTDHIDLTRVTDRMTIKEAVQRGNVKDAIEILIDKYPEVLLEDLELLFRLVQQQLIELIRNGKVEEALMYAEAELAPMAEEDEDFLEDVEKTVALLAFEDPSTSPVGELLYLSRRSKLASEVNAALLTSQEQEKDPKLRGLLKMLIWIQKELDEKAAYPSMLLAGMEENPAI